MSGHRARVTAKRKKKLRDERHSLKKQRDDFDRILRLMGLGDLGKRFGDEVPSLLTRVFPRPRVALELGLAPDTDLKAKAEELRSTLDGVNIRIGHDTLSHADFFSVWVGLYHLCNGSEPPSNSRDERREWEEVMGRLKRFGERYEPEMMQRFRDTLSRFLAKNSRLDGPIYTARHGVSVEGRKMVCTTTLGRSSPESIYIDTQGGRRRAFRCGDMDDYRSGQITWISWDDKVLGPGTSGQVPVYIQSHAVEQAHKRLGVPKNVCLLHYFLVNSLRETRVSFRRDGQLGVEVRLGGERVGYLIAERIDDKVLVKTFLLITMQGTPEGSRLHQRLRIGREDLGYLGLDNLAKLTMTDLLRDDEIAGIFRECGCEGILALARGDVWAGVIQGFAAEFKTYFGPSLSH